MQLTFLLIAFVADNPVLNGKLDLLAGQFNTYEECLTAQNEIEKILKENEAPLVYTCAPIYSLM